MLTKEWWKDGMITELVTLMGDGDSARFLLLEIGFPAGKIPSHPANAEVFWQLVFKDLEHGILLNGPELLRKAMASRYPGNRMFQAGSAAAHPESKGTATAAPVTSNAPEGISVFISYSHKDKKYHDDLLVFLALMQRQNLISAWSDRLIDPGTPWRGEIDHQLEKARLILALVSADFMNSDYAYTKEMGRALARARAGEAIVVPIVVRPCDWRSSPLGELQALPTGAKAVSTWNSPDEAFTDIVDQLRRLIGKRN